MLKLSSVFKRNAEAYKAGKRFIINQGGTSSTKTFSVLQLLTTKALKCPDICIDIVGQTGVHLTQGVLRDMPIVCAQFGVNFDDCFNKSYRSFKPNGTINFMSFDNLGKAHGGRRDILFLNEANHIGYPIVQQLMARTRETIFIDYNPTNEFWAHQEIMEKPENNGKWELIKSTYKDNPWLEKPIVDYIESHKGDGNNNFWRVYGLGEIGIAEGIIFDHYKIETFNYNLLDFDSVVIGQDFGFNHFNAIILMGKKDGKIYILKEYCCTNKDTAEIIQDIEGEFPKDCIMWCDSAEPDRIQMFKKAGYYAKSVQKSINRVANSLIGVSTKTYTLSQIEWFKLHDVVVHSNCKHLIKELKTWQYKQDRLTGEWLDEPMDIGEDAIKAMLYGCNGWMNQKRSIYD